MVITVTRVLEFLHCLPRLPTSVNSYYGYSTVLGTRGREKEVQSHFLAVIDTASIATRK